MLATITIEQHLEELRIQMYESVKRFGLTDPRTVSISQELDQVVIIVLRKRLGL